MKTVFETGREIVSFTLIGFPTFLCLFAANCSFLSIVSHSTKKCEKNVPVMMHAGRSKCRSYGGHLQAGAYNEATKAIPQGEALVLFHYMTRSFQDFSERKLSRYAGMYVDDFRERREKAAEQSGTTPSDAELFDDLEDSLGINLAAPVCKSAIKANYGSRCCS